MMSRILFLEIRVVQHDIVIIKAALKQTRICFRRKRSVRRRCNHTRKYVASCTTKSFRYTSRCATARNMREVRYRGIKHAHGPPSRRRASAARMHTRSRHGDTHSLGLSDSSISRILVSRLPCDPFVVFRLSLFTRDFYSPGL